MSGYPSSQPPHYVSSANGANGSSNYNAEQYRSRANSSASTTTQDDFVNDLLDSYYTNEPETIATSPTDSDCLSPQNTSFSSEGKPLRRTPRVSRNSSKSAYRRKNTANRSIIRSTVSQGNLSDSFGRTIDSNNSLQYDGNISPCSDTSNASLSTLLENVRLLEFSLNNPIDGDMSSAKTSTQIVASDTLQKHELTRTTTGSSIHSATSNTSSIYSFSHSSTNDNTQRLNVISEPVLVESPLELPADIFLQYTTNTDFHSGYSSSTLSESTSKDANTTRSTVKSEYAYKREAIQKPPPLDMYLNNNGSAYSQSVSNEEQSEATAKSIAIEGGKLMTKEASIGLLTPLSIPSSSSPPSSDVSSLSRGFFTFHSGLGTKELHKSASTSSSLNKSITIYPALLSTIAHAFRMRITLQTHYKDSLEYKLCFSGRDAVDALCLILKTGNRNLALLVGRALESQRFFHDVTYDYRLRDNPNEIYQFREDAVTRSMLGDGHDNTQSPYSMDDGYSNDKNYVDSPLPITTSESESIDLAPSALPNGVFTLLADCYSPTCTRETLCYSISCPRRLEQQVAAKTPVDNTSERINNQADKTSGKKATFWIESVPKEISDSVPKEEQKRQEIIYEIIYTEKDFVDDLEILERLYMEPLRYANIIWDPAELEDFITQVFHNVSVIRQISTPLSQALLKRQEEKAVVERIGDIFLAHVDNFEPFVSYGAHQPYGKHHLDTATQKYHELPRWLEQRERMPESRKLPIQSFLARPTTRLARYPLLLEAAIKASPEGHPDREDLALAIEKIRVLLRNINSEAGRADTRIRLTKLNDELLCSPSDLQELALLNPERQLIREGTLKKRANVEQVEVTVFLFDHYLLLAKRRKPKDGGGYKVHKRPIPLEMLSIIVGDEASLAGGSASPVTTSASRGHETTKAGFPITLAHLGRNGMEVVLYASSQAERWQWREKIEAQREVVVRSRQIFNIVTLSDRHFHKTSRVNCSAVFNQGRKLVIGTDDGVYVGMEAHPDTMAKTLDLDKVHKIEILEDYNMVLILHDKNGTLTAYSMDCLMSPDLASTTARNGRKVKSHVSFFKVGICLNRVLVCVVKSAALYSTIEVLEPMSAVSNKKKPLGMILRNNEALKTYRELYIPTESSSIHFLKTKLCIGCNKGFEVLDPETKDSICLLDSTDETLNFVLRRESARPIAIFRIRNGDFLLCYDEFAFFVNKNGRRSRPNWLVTWEGEPSAFAINYPYILAFDSKFIEVRHVVTGELEQIIPTGTLRSLSTHSESIHCVTTGRNDYQHVFKLTRNPQIQGTSSNM